MRVVLGGRTPARVDVSMEGRVGVLAMAIASAAFAVHAQMPEEPQAGVLLPLTGKPSTLGEHLQPTAIMAGDDFD